MNTTVKNTAIVASSLVIGYVVGGLFGLPQTSGNLSKGDITKVSKFHKKSIENRSSAYQQKLLNDATALGEATEVTKVLSDKLSQFSELVDLSMSVAGDIPELNKEVAALESVYGLSENAMYAGKVASASFEKLQSGNDNELAIDVEQASQNLTLAYLFIDHQVGLGKDFVTAADNYLKNNKNNEDLAMVRDLWAVFCAENAIINGNDAELAYWGKQEIASSNLGITASLGASYQHLSAIKELTAVVQELSEISGLKGDNNLEGFGVLHQIENLKQVDNLQKVHNLQNVENLNLVLSVELLSQRNNLNSKVNSLQWSTNGGGTGVTMPAIHQYASKETLK